MAVDAAYPGSGRRRYGFKLAASRFILYAKLFSQDCRVMIVCRKLSTEVGATDRLIAAAQSAGMSVMEAKEKTGCVIPSHEYDLCFANGQRIYERQPAEKRGRWLVISKPAVVMKITVGQDGSVTSCVLRGWLRWILTVIPVLCGIAAALWHVRQGGRDGMMGELLVVAIFVALVGGIPLAMGIRWFLGCVREIRMIGRVACCAGYA